MQIEGPYFVYESAPSLFLGRAGYGPLRIVWDTNILVDYLQHGNEIWEELDYGITDEDYSAELDALSLLINLWMRRDIRITVLEHSIVDARGKLSAQREVDRANAVRQVAGALMLERSYDDDDDPDDLPASPPADLQDLLSLIPAGSDRKLVEEAIAEGAHVFLTRDRGILRQAEGMKAAALLLASPLGLLEELVSCGAMLAVMRPETMYWPLPDLQRMSHLIQALPAGGGDQN